MKILPDRASSYAAEVDSVFWLILLFVSIGFVITLAVLLYAIFSKRERAKYFTGSNWREYRWVAFGMIGIALADFIILGYELKVWHKTQWLPEETHYKVGVLARQWNFEYYYPGPDGQLWTNDDIIVRPPQDTLVLPLNKKVMVELRSADVIHALFIPAFRFKYDCIPGRTIQRWFEPTKEGIYMVSCAELCGVLHSRMRSTVKVVPESAFQAFLQQKRMEPLATK